MEKLDQISKHLLYVLQKLRFNISSTNQVTEFDLELHS